MNTIELKGDWEEQKGILKQKFAALADDDLLFAKSKKEELLEKIQVKLGITKKEIFQIIGVL